MDRNSEVYSRAITAHLDAHPELTAGGRVTWLYIDHDEPCATFNGDYCDCTPVIERYGIDSTRNLMRAGFSRSCRVIRCGA